MPDQGRLQGQVAPHWSRMHESVCVRHYHIVRVFSTDGKLVSQRTSVEARIVAGTVISCTEGALQFPKVLEGQLTSNT